jgi:hypothetical protein
MPFTSPRLRNRPAADKDCQQASRELSMRAQASAWSRIGYRPSWTQAVLGTSAGVRSIRPLTVVIGLATY